VPLAYFCADLCAVLAVDVNGVSLARLRERAKRADIAAVCGGKAPALGGGGAIATLQCDLLDLVDGDAAVGPDGARGQKKYLFRRDSEPPCLRGGIRPGHSGGNRTWSSLCSLSLLYRKGERTP